MTNTPKPEVLASLVERLNSHMGKQDVPILLADCREAATTITTLAAERDALKAALERIADPRNAHFAGDAAALARMTIATLERTAQP